MPIQLFDRRIIRLAEDKYCLMLLSGESGTKELVNGRYYEQKRWRAFTDNANGQYAFTMGKLQYLIYRYIADNIETDGTVKPRKAKGQKFENPNELRKFFTDGLRYIWDFRQYADAGNHFIVGFAGDDKNDVQICVDSADELMKQYETLREEGRENVYIGFAERNLKTLGQTVIRNTSREINEWYAVTASVNDGDDERKLYYRRRSNKRLLFTDEVVRAKVFETAEAAQACIQSFPELENVATFGIERQDGATTIVERKRIKQSEAGLE